MNEQRRELPSLSPFCAWKGQNWISDHLFSSYFGSPPRFFFLVQTGKKQGAPENRNKGNLSTHSRSISTCPRSNQTSPGCLPPRPLHNLLSAAAVAQRLILRTVQRSGGGLQAEQQHPLLLAQGSNVHNSLVPIRSSQSAELCFTVRSRPFLGWKSWWRVLARQSLHPPLLAASWVSSGLYFFSVCLLRGFGKRRFPLPLCPLLSLFSPQSVLFLLIWFVFSLGGCVCIPSPSCLCIRQKRR